MIDSEAVTPSGRTSKPKEIFFTNADRYLKCENWNGIPLPVPFR